VPGCEAVNRPALLIAPPELFQATPVLVVPETLAVNCWPAPLVMVAEAGETLMETMGCGATTLT